MGIRFCLHLQRKGKKGSPPCFFVFCCNNATYVEHIVAQRITALQMRCNKTPSATSFWGAFCSTGWSVLLHSLEHFAPQAGAFCSIAWSELLHSLERVAPSYGASTHRCCHLTTLLQRHNTLLFRRIEAQWHHCIKIRISAVRARARDGNATLPKREPKTTIRLL